ncbi:DUF541 domain-containing protein [Patescibacteria group bacterium]|nr:MAG: DUF541 domain-containing protein [Patescibacteria group bacterium]
MSLTKEDMIPKWKENRPASLALVLLCAFGTMFLWAKTDLAMRQARQVGRPEPLEHVISVEGTGKALGKPDIATVYFGVESRGADVASAQTKNTESMNALLGKMKALGISEDDIQTSSYNSYEDIEYTSSGRQPKGWVVSQQVTVKVRDVAKIASVLQTAGQNGATNISGPSFTIDDPSNLLAEAREKALKDAQEKAVSLAATLGVRLERVVGYSEYSGGGPVPYYDRAMSAGFGGGIEAPNIQPGQNEVSLNVSVTYKLVD